MNPLLMPTQPRGATQAIVITFLASLIIIVGYYAVRRRK
jgi:hypothetical protein